MRKVTRQVMVGIAIAITTASVTRVEAADAASSRIRSTSPVLRELILRATERSATFRGLGEAISVSDGIVYVEEGDCGHGVRACLAAVAEAGANRILRVKVDTRKAEWDLIGSIGHELQHVVEVLSDPTVRSSAAMYFFYARTGLRSTPGAFETKAARQIGETVRREVRPPDLSARAGSDSTGFQR